MKRIFYFFVVSCMCFLYSCKDENYTTVIMEGFYNSKKAVQVSSTSTIYENMARQPELADELINLHVYWQDTKISCICCRLRAEKKNGRWEWLAESVCRLL